MEGLLRAEGAQVVPLPPHEGVSGVLLAEPKPEIAVNAAHRINQQRFTMAHVYWPCSYYKSLNKLMCMTHLDDTKTYEREANRFAACLCRSTWFADWCTSMTPRQLPRG